MKKFVRGKIGRALSMVLMVMLMVPSLLTPLALPGYATSDQRQQIIILPFDTAAKNTPPNLGNDIITAVRLSLVKHLGVQVSSLNPTSPMLASAIAQLENAEDRAQLKADYEVAANPQADLASREQAAANLIRPLNITAVVFGTIDQYEFTADPNQALIRVTACKITIGKDGQAYKEPIVVRGKSRILPNQQGLQSTHTAEAISNLATELGARLTGNLPAAQPGTRVDPKTPTPPGTRAETPKQPRVKQTGERKSGMPSWAWLAIGALALGAAVAGGSSSSAPPPPGDAHAIGTPSGVEIMLAMPPQQVREFRLYREGPFEPSVRAASRSRVTGTLVATLTSANVTIRTIGGQPYVVLTDGALSSPPPMAGKLYSYQLVTVLTAGGEKEYVVYNADTPSGLSRITLVGPGIPAPVNTLQVQHQGGSIVGLTWTINDPYQLVRSFAVQRRSAGSSTWVTDSTLTNAAARSATAVVSQAGAYDFRVISAGVNSAWTYPGMVLTVPVTVTFDSLPAPTELLVTPHALNGGRQVKLVLQWREPIDPLVQGYQVYRQSSTRAQRSRLHDSVSSPGTKLPSSGRTGRTRGGVAPLRPVGSRDSGTWEPIGGIVPKGTPGGTKSVEDANVEDNRWYAYRVRSVAGSLQSDMSQPSNEVLVDIAPGNVRNLAASAGDGRVTLTWLAPDVNADGSPISLMSNGGFRIFRLLTPPASPSGYSYTELAALTPWRTVNWVSPTTPYQTEDTTAANRTTFYYAVVPFDNQQQSSIEPYPYVSATPQPTPHSMTMTAASTAILAGSPGQVLTITVRDAGGVGIAGIPVTVSCEAGKGTVSPTSVVTNTSGLAITQYTPPATVTDSISVLITAQATNIPTLTATWTFQVSKPTAATILVTPAATTLRVVPQGMEQTPPAASVTLVTVKVTDANGAPMSGLLVMLDSSDKEMAFVDPSQPTVFVPFLDRTPEGATNAAGEFPVQIRAGTVARAITLTAICGTAMGATTMQILPGPVASLQVTLPDQVTGSAAGTVTVLDGNGNPVPNTVVLLSISQGTVQPTSVATGTNGQASFTVQAGSYSGPAVITATTQGVTPVSKAFTFLQQLNPELMAGSRYYTAGQTRPMTWMLKDAAWQPLANTAVRASVQVGQLSTGTDTGTTITLTTGADGQVTFSFTAPAVLGPVIMRFHNAATNAQIGSDVTLFVVLPTPDGLTAATASSTSVSLAWTGVPNSSGYTLECSTDQSNWTVVATVGPTSTGYLHTGLEPGGQYFYRIRANHAQGYHSEWSAVVQAVTSLAAPPALVAVPGNDSNIILTWNDVNGEDGYRIQRSANGSTDWADLTTTARDVVTFTDANLAPDATYYYRIAATNAGGDSPWSNIASATTQRVQAAKTFHLQVKEGEPARVYYSSRADDQLAAASRQSTLLTLTGYTAQGIGADGTRVKLVTTKGTFAKVLTDQVVSPNGKEIVGVLGAGGQMTVLFLGRKEDGATTGMITLPALEELGVPQFSAVSLEPASDSFVLSGEMLGIQPVLVGPPHHIVFKPLVPPAPPLNEPQPDRWPVLFQEQTMTIGAVVTDLAGQSVLADMPIWFTQSWEKLTNPNAEPSTEYYNRALGHANINGTIAMTNDAGEASGGFASNYSGLYTIRAFALRRVFNRTLLEGINLTDDGGLPTVPIPNDVADSLLPARNGVAPTTLGNAVTDSTNVLNKTFAFYDHWTILTNSHTRINCDATQTSRITFGATDEHGKKVLPGVPFTVSTNLGVLQLDNGTYGTTVKNTFNERSESYILSRGTIEHPTVGFVSLTFNNLRSVQPLYHINNLVTHYGPALNTALDWPTMGVGFYISPTSLFGLLHRIAGATDDVLDPTLKTATLTFNLRDVDNNPFPNGYFITISGTSTSFYRNGFLGSGGVMGQWQGTYPGPNLNEYGVDEIIDDLMITISGPTTAGDFDSRTDWLDRTIHTERPHTGTITPRNPSDTGLYLIRFDQERVITVSTRTVSGRGNLPTYPIRFKLEKIYRADEATLSAEEVRLGANSLASVTLHPGSVYGKIRIYAYYDKSGNGDMSSDELLADTGVLTIGLPTPSDLIATSISSSEIRLNWLDAVDESGYRIERSLNGTSGWNHIATVGTDVTTYTDAGLNHGTQYFYRVVATSSAGTAQVHSQYSNVATNFTRPLAPESLNAVVLSPTQIRLNWSNVLRELGFVLEQSTNLTTWVEAGTTATDVLTLTVDGLNPGTLYHFRVRASNLHANGALGGLSTPSPTVSVYTMPAVPVNFKVVNLTDSSVRLSWNDVVGETGYALQYSLDNTVWMPLASLPADTTSYEATGLSANTLHYFRLAAVNASGSSWTAAISITTIPSSPEPATAVAVSNNQINVYWNLVPGSTGYKVWRSFTGVSGWIDLTVTALGPTITVFQDKELTPGTLHYYRVIALNAAGGQSAPATAHTATFPENPLEPVLMPISATQIDLTWGEVTGATGYRVQRSLNGTTGWMQVGPDLDGTVTVYSDTGLTQSTRYHYRVIALSEGGPSAPGAVKDALTYPAAPDNLTAMVVSATRIDLSWNAVPRVTGYQVERSLTGIGGWTLLTDTPITATNYSDTSCVGGTQYFYRVVSINDTGHSLPAIVNTITQPAQPTNLSAVPVSATRIDLSWSAVIGATSYSVERRFTDTLAWVEIATGLNTNTYADLACDPGTRYDYRVIAASGVGFSLPSDPVIGVLTMPDAPAGLVAQAINANRIDLAWTGVTGVSAYRVQRSLNGATGWTDLVPDPTTTQFSDTGVQAGTRYYYRVMALNASGASQPSNVADALTHAGMPTGLAAVAISTTQINLTWTAGLNAEGYRVERSLDGATWGSIGTPTATSFADTTCAVGTRYYYRVLATNDAGDSAPSQVVDTITFPGAVTDLAATELTDTQINLTWTATAGAASYRIDRSLNGIVWTTNYATSSTAGYLDAGCAAGVTYYYRVYAVNESGESAVSNVVSATTYPAPPTNLTATGVSTTRINLAWMTAAGSTGYRIERSLDGVDWATIGTSATPSYADLTCEIGTVYFYRVFASTATRESAPSNVASAITFPAPVTDLVATAVSDTRISLVWSATTGAASYRIDRSLNGSIWETGYGASTITAFEDAGCGAGTVYYYRVYAVNASGVSAASNTAQALTNPGPPTALTVVGYGPNNVVLAWGVGQGATSYRVERSPDGAIWSEVGATAALTFNDTTCAAGVTYYFRVIAINATGDSHPSNVVQQLTTPNKPQGLAATALSSTRVMLTWTDTTGETGYRVERSLNPAFGWQQIGGLIAQDATSFIDDTCQALITYYYRLVAFNASGDSPYSDIATVTTTAVRNVVSMNPVRIMDGNPERIYYSPVPEDQVIDRAPVYTDLLIEGVGEGGLPASWATVDIATNRGSFKPLMLNQTLSADKKAITVVLDANGQAIVRFQGRPDDAAPGVPNLIELGSPILLASSEDIPYPLTFQGPTPKLIGPPHRIALSTTMPWFPYQVPPAVQYIWEGMDLLYQDATMGITATVTDLAGEIVLPFTPIWFTQSWTQLFDVNQTTDPGYYNKAVGAGNFGNAFGMTDALGKVTAQFASSHSGVYMLHAFALRKDFDYAKLSPIDNLTTANPANYQPQLLAADTAGNPVTFTTNVVNKTYVFWNRWQILSVSKDRINCDGTMTSTFALRGRDEDNKLAMPGVPFRIRSDVQKGSALHPARLELEDGNVIATTDYVYFNERSEARILSRGNLNRSAEGNNPGQWIGMVSIQMNNLRPQQPYYRRFVVNPANNQYLTHYGPALSDAIAIYVPQFRGGVRRSNSVITGTNDRTDGSIPTSTGFFVKLVDANNNPFPGGYTVTVTCVNIAGADLPVQLIGEVNTDGEWSGSYSTPLNDDGKTMWVSVEVEGEYRDSGDYRDDWGLEPEKLNFIVERPVTADMTYVPPAPEIRPLDYNQTHHVRFRVRNHEGDPVSSGFRINFEAVGIAGQEPTLTQAFAYTETGGYVNVYFNTGTTYSRFFIRAYYDRNGSGTYNGPASGELLRECSVMQIGMEAPPVFTATAASSTQINLAWTAPNYYVTRYEVQWSLDGASWTDLNMNIPAATTTLSHTGRTPETRYHYRIRTVFINIVLGLRIESVWITRNAITDPAPPPPPPPPVPAAPEGVTANPVSPTRIDVIWMASTGATSYIVERKTPAEWIWPATPLATVTAPTTAYIDAACTANTTYEYRITAVNASGSSPPSDPPVTATTPP